MMVAVAIKANYFHYQVFRNAVWFEIFYSYEGVFFSLIRVFWILKPVDFAGKFAWLKRMKLSKKGRLCRRNFEFFTNQKELLKGNCVLKVRISNVYLTPEWVYEICAKCTRFASRFGRSSKPDVFRRWFEKNMILKQPKTEGVYLKKKMTKRTRPKTVSSAIFLTIISDMCCCVIKDMLATMFFRVFSIIAKLQFNLHTSIL